VISRGRDLARGTRERTLYPLVAKETINLPFSKTSWDVCRGRARGGAFWGDQSDLLKEPELAARTCRERFVRKNLPNTGKSSSSGTRREGLYLWGHSFPQGDIRIS